MTQHQTFLPMASNRYGKAQMQWRPSSLLHGHQFGYFNIKKRALRATEAELRSFVEQRPVFQAMLKRIVEQRDVDYVVIDLRSRAFRNYIDAAIVKRQLEGLGVKLVSAGEDFGEGVWADAMEAITDVFNDVQVKLSGQDISLKMLNKAQNGGTPGPAKLGYQNVSKIVGGHKINTIAPDPDRHRLITAAFDLFATGEHTIDTLREQLTDAGLTTPSTGRPVSRHTVHKILRDRTYIGSVVYKGVEYPNGRHQPLVTVEAFERVQRILDSHSGSGVRYRTHPHYLNGLLWCDWCGHRFILQRAQGRQGGVYRQLDDAQQRLDTLLHALALLDDPARLYRTGDETVRTILNKAFFAKLYIDGKKVAGNELREPFDVLNAAHNLYRTYHSQGPTGYRVKASTLPPKSAAKPKPSPGTAATTGAKTARATRDNTKAAASTGDGPTDQETLIHTLRTTLEGQGWSKALIVAIRDLNPEPAD
jgi:DNA invertase Pin-like site-specific DNA recombinase